MNVFGLFSVPVTDIVLDNLFLLLLLCCCLLKGLDIVYSFDRSMYLALVIVFCDNNGTGVIMKCYLGDYEKRADGNKGGLIKQQNNRTKASINTILGEAKIIFSTYLSLRSLSTAPRSKFSYIVLIAM
jgi:hypothetical protein